MYNVANGDIIQATLSGSDGVSLFENVRHYLVSAVAAPSVTISDFLAVLNSSWTTEYKAIMSDQVSLQAWAGVKVNLAGQPQTDNEYSLAGYPTPGDMAGDQMPAFTAAVISLRTGTAGRRNRGRLYTFPAAESANDGGGVLTAGYVTDVQAFAAKVKATNIVTVGSGSATFTPVVLSKVGATTMPILNTIVRLGWGTQRRRKIGRGQ